MEGDGDDDGATTESLHKAGLWFRCTDRRGVEVDEGPVAGTGTGRSAHKTSAGSTRLALRPPAKALLTLVNMRFNFPTFFSLDTPTSRLSMGADTTRGCIPTYFVVLTNLFIIYTGFTFAIPNGANRLNSNRRRFC